MNNTEQNEKILIGFGLIIGAVFMFILFVDFAIRFLF